MSWNDDVDFHVRGYNGRILLLETWHKGEASKDARGWLIERYINGTLYYWMGSQP